VLYRFKHFCASSFEIPEERRGEEERDEELEKDPDDPRRDLGDDPRRPLDLGDPFRLDDPDPDVVLNFRLRIFHVCCVLGEDDIVDIVGLDDIRRNKNGDRERYKI
jgi:hypothetical protein